jgi:hypothetical protein
MPTSKVNLTSDWTAIASADAIFQNTGNGRVEIAFTDSGAIAPTGGAMHTLCCGDTLDTGRIAGVAHVRRGRGVGDPHLVVSTTRAMSVVTTTEPAPVDNSAANKTAVEGETGHTDVLYGDSFVGDGGIDGRTPTYPGTAGAWFDGLNAKTLGGALVSNDGTGGYAAWLDTGQTRPFEVVATFDPRTFAGTDQIYFKFGSDKVASGGAETKYAYLSMRPAENTARVYVKGAGGTSDTNNVATGFTATNAEIKMKASWIGNSLVVTITQGANTFTRTITTTTTMTTAPGSGIYFYCNAGIDVKAVSGQAA